MECELRPHHQTGPRDHSPLNAKKGPFSQDAPATQRLRDLATRQPCNEKDPLSGASSFNSQLARTTDPVFAPSAG